MSEKRALPKLTPRLAAVASQVRPGARLLDVGTDHAYLPAFLVGTGICPAAVASDVREGPCARARATVEALHLEDRIRVVRADGLQGHNLQEIDDIVLAGMGGELMLSILGQVPQVRCKRLRLILQPQTELAAVRKTMTGWGFELAGEYLAAEGRRLYHIMRFAYDDGTPHSLDRAQAEFGRPEADAALLAACRERQRASLTRELEGLSRSTAPDHGRMAELRELLELLTKEEYA